MAVAFHSEAFSSHRSFPSQGPLVWLRVCFGKDVFVDCVLCVPLSCLGRCRDLCRPKADHNVIVSSATCEKQITVPNNALLYCSTRCVYLHLHLLLCHNHTPAAMTNTVCRCRKADSLKPLSVSLQTLSSFTFSKVLIPFYPSSSLPRPRPDLSSKPRKMAPVQPGIPSLSVSPPAPTHSAPKKAPTTTTTASPADERPTPTAARRPRTRIESTAAYRFLLLFQRNTPHADAEGDADSNASDHHSTSDTISPTVTNASSHDFDEVGSKLATTAENKGDVSSATSTPITSTSSSVPSLSTSTTSVETVSGNMTPDMKNCAVSAGVIDKASHLHRSSAA